MSKPSFFNGAVSNFGDPNADFLIVGLAPGLKGANQTGRPFTGDFSGQLLFNSLLKTGFAHGAFENRADDSLTLHRTMITNAVRCVPPENKPTTAEVLKCLPFLNNQIKVLSDLKVILALGRLAHNATLKALQLKQSHYPFAHHAVHQMPEGYTLFDSYHCSRYNVNTGVLTAAMFEAVLMDIKRHIS